MSAGLGERVGDMHRPGLLAEFRNLQKTTDTAQAYQRLGTVASGTTHLPHGIEARPARHRTAGHVRVMCQWSRAAAETTLAGG